MKTRRLFVLAAAFFTAACSSIDAHKPERAPPEGATDRQILLMLKESPAQHYRPGYFPQQSYSASASVSQLQTARRLGEEYGFTLVSDWAMPSIGVRCFLAEVTDGRVPRDVASRLAADARVESAQPVQVFRALGHNDTYYELQTNAKILRLDELHRIATGKHVKIAQLDTGVELTHPDLEGQLFEAGNFVDGTGYVAESHGTAVAGIIAAKADNRIGIVGVAPGAKLLPLRACWEDSHQPGSALCTSFTLAKAMQYVLTHSASVVNLSLSGPRDRLLERLIDKAIEQGITVVGAVDPSEPAGSFPAAHPGVIAVGSAGSGLVIGGEVLAPGEHVLTTTLNGSYGFLSGSSFATAQVSGIAALLLEKNSKLRPADVALVLREHVYESESEGSVVDACAALASVTTGLDCGCCGLTHPSARRQARAH